METFLRRAYGLRTPGEHTWDDHARYPFWDYRCRRGSSSPDSRSTDSSSDAGTSIMTGDVDDLTSYMTASDGGEPKQRRFKIMDDITTSNTSEPESISLCVSELGSIVENDTLLLGDAEKMVMQFIAKDSQDKRFISELYRPLFQCVGVKQDVYFVSQIALPDEVSNYDEKNGLDKLSMPSLAVVIFLREEEMKGEDVWAIMGRNVDKSSWRFHHSEHVSRGRLQLYENNSQDYLTARPDLPLCAMRQIHCGKKMLRFLRFVSSENWRDNVRLYGLLLGKDPEVLKQDFCLFTSSTHKEYCLQLSLKKIPKTIKCQQTTNGVLCFRVCQLGHIVPLLPNVCTPLTDDRWQTTDLDGNVIFLDVVRMRDRSCEPVPDLSDLEICDYFSDNKDCPLYNDSNEQTSVQQSSPHPSQSSTSLSGKKVKSLKHVQKKSGTGTHGHYDSMEELGLLIKDLAGKMEGTKVRSIATERDACGMVDGASHHSEGNTEDRMCLPFDPDSKNYFTNDIDEVTPSKSISLADNLSASSTSSSSKAELNSLNVAKFSSAYRHRPEVMETVSFFQRKAPKKHSQIPKTYAEPAGKSQLMQKVSPSPAYSHHQEKFDVIPEKTVRHIKKGSKKSSKEGNIASHSGERVIFNSRPPLPSYSEIQSRKQQISMHDGYPAQRYSQQMHNRYDSGEDELYDVPETDFTQNLYRSKSVDELDPKPKTISHKRIERSQLESSNSSDMHVQKHVPQGREWHGLKVHSHPTSPNHFGSLSANQDSVKQNHEVGKSDKINTKGPPHSDKHIRSREHNHESAISDGHFLRSQRHGKGEHDRHVPSGSRELPPYRPRPIPPPPGGKTADSVSSPERQTTFNRFEFNGTTVPRFGRNNKHRQSVVPPPSFHDSRYINENNNFSNGLNSKGYKYEYEESAIDVPGVVGTITESPEKSNSEAPTLGFYV